MVTLFKFKLISFFICSNLVFYTVNNQLFYEALFCNSVTTIDKALDKLEENQSNSVSVAYKGGLLMKKSGFMKTVTEKVKVFKEGYKLLEGEIEKKPLNVEYRFIRLTIQENAPKILKYNKNIKQDKILILDGYNSLNTKIKVYIREYAHQSNVLSITDFP